MKAQIKPVTADTPTVVDFQAAAAAIDNYYKIMDSEAAHKKARGFADGLLFCQAIPEDKYHRLIDYIDAKLEQLRKNRKWGE
jgi:uncharacterized protein YaaR (DUF327 family)